MNNLAQRAITAIVLIAGLLVLLFKANTLAFAGVVLVFGALAVWELWRLLDHKNLSSLWVMLFVYGACAVQFWVGQWQSVLWGLGGLHVCVSVWVLWKKPRLSGLGSGVYGAALLACVVYAMTVLQGFGVWVLLTSMLVVWAADVGGYFFGKAFAGKLIARGLAPTISPKKSWEGAIGGVLLGLVVTLGCVFGSGAGTSMQTWVIPGVRVSDFLMDNFSSRLLIEVWFLIPVITAIAAYSVTGDLLESLLKRQAGVKDSSQLLPGHGGVLDRIDALIPVLPLCAAWASMVGYR